jgi:hypothetical protein
MCMYEYMCMHVCACGCVFLLFGEPSHTHTRTVLLFIKKNTHTQYHPNQQTTQQQKQQTTQHPPPPPKKNKNKHTLALTRLGGHSLLRAALPPPNTTHTHALTQPSKLPQTHTKNQQTHQHSRVSEGTASFVQRCRRQQGVGVGGGGVAASCFIVIMNFSLPWGSFLAYFW